MTICMIHIYVRVYCEATMGSYLHIYTYIYIPHGPWNLFFVSQLFLWSKQLANDVPLCLRRFCMQIMRCRLFAPCITVAPKAWLMVSSVCLDYLGFMTLCWGFLALVDSHVPRWLTWSKAMFPPTLSQMLCLFVSILAIKSFFSLSECGSSRLVNLVALVHKMLQQCWLDCPKRWLNLISGIPWLSLSFWGLEFGPHQ